MASKLSIISPIPPSVNNYLNYRVQRAPGKRRLFVQSYKSEDSVQYENEFLEISQRAIKKQGWIMPDKSTYVFVDCTFYFPKHGMDSNNHYKLPLDVLQTAGVYIDDSKVLETTKRVYIDAQNPRMELTIYPAEFVGVFDSEDQFERFKTMNCIFCKKKPERCSVITKALENRLTGDIDINGMNCKVIKCK